jgi:hypothetical protein
VLLVLAVLSGLCQACSLAPGYFHQVTVIRGRVVGKSLGPLGFTWLRQSFSVGEATLTLYEYRSARLDELKKIASVSTDSHGDFDFGSIPKGHYFLNIIVRKSDRLGGLFEVEVTDAVKATKNITIDVSPIHPDCKGGHEFIETKV